VSGGVAKNKGCSQKLNATISFSEQQAALTLECIESDLFQNFLKFLKNCFLCTSVIS
jgi:uncharacterized protein (DUF983 family)